MIPLIVIALGLGVALTAYEFSPRARSRVDAFVSAIRSANAAHQAADVHLTKAHAATVTAVHHAQQAEIARQTAPRPVPRVPPRQPPMQQPPMQQPPMQQPPMQQPPMQQPPMQQPPMQQPPMQQPPMQQPPMQPAPDQVAEAEADAQAQAAQNAADEAVDHTVAATEANQEAAKNTADAAKTAQTAREKQAAADSAAKVLAREKHIAAALKSLGIGQCGVRTYKRVTERAKNAILAKLRAEGMVVTGDNPWNIDTHQYDVKLRAVWDFRVSEVKLIVTSGKGGYLGAVTCEEIWKKIDPIMKSVTG